MCTTTRVLAVLTWLMVGAAHADPRIGDPAPRAALTGLDGKPVTLPVGKPFIVDFFATWCGPCHQAVGVLDGLVRAAGGKIALVVVDVKESAEPVQTFLADHPLPPGAVMALDPTGENAQRWGQHRFPTTYIIDAAGVIRHINRGFGPGYEERMRTWLKPFMKEE